MVDLSSLKSISSPMISVGIVVFDGVEHIRKSLESVINQSYKNIELIVVDGGSSDGTRDILSKYVQYITVFVSEPDQGIYDAMNKVCSLASGDWLIFLGCDDVLLDNLDDIAELMNQPDAVYYGDAIFRSSGKTIGGEFSKYKLMNWNICHQSVFYPKPVYKKYRYSLSYEWLADYEYNIRLFGDKVKFVYLGKVVSIYNDKGGSSLGDADFESAKLKLIRKSFGTPYWLVKLARNVIAKAVNIVRANTKPGLKP